LPPRRARHRHTFTLGRRETLVPCGMTTNWDALGHTLGESLAAFHAIVVCGMEPDATARVAIAMARVQAARRRVAVGDLFGDVPALHSLIDDGDVHGIVDSFLYGVSLTRIARPVAGAGDLFVLPTGSETPDYEALLPQARWGRLAAGFREAGSLVILVVPADAPRLTDLVAQMDGAVIVGDRVPAQLPLAQVVTFVRGESPPATPAAIRPPVERPNVERPPDTADVARSRIGLSLGGAAGIGAVAAIALLMGWLTVAPLPHAWQRKSPLLAHPGVVNPSVDSAAGLDEDSTGGTTTLRPINPEDSATASAYAIELVTANTEAGAILKLEADSLVLPAATLSPELIQGSTWFKLMCGAFAARASADSLLKVLRSGSVLDSASGVVVRAPYAFLIDSGVVSAAIPELLAELSRRGLPVYALRQDNGTAWVLIGAFETPAQASLYEGSLRASALAPQLVYRKGRMF